MNDMTNEQGVPIERQMELFEEYDITKGIERLLKTLIYQHVKNPFIRAFVMTLLEGIIPLLAIELYALVEKREKMYFSPEEISEKASRYHP